MRLAAYVILLFTISVMAYLFGYPSVLIYLFTEAGGINTDPVTLISTMADNIINSEAAVALLAIGAVAVVATFLSGGFVAMYLVPMILVMTVLNLLVYPLSFIFDSALPLEFQIISIAFFNLLTILTMLGFIRGSV